MTLTTNSSSRALTTLPAHLQVDSVMDDNPRREVRFGFIIVFAFFGIFLGWSLFARLDAAAYAPGAVAVAGHRQTVQHESGGTVSVLNVKEGQHVNAGDVLMELSADDVGAATRSMQAQVINLEAQIARLMAEREGRSVVSTPVEFAALTGDEKLEAENALRQQQRELQARGGAISAQKQVLNQRVSQLSQMIEGYGQQVTQTNEQSRLIGEELTGTKDLARQGYASENRVRALERTQAQLVGSAADLKANAARTKDQISENRMQALSLDSQHLEDVAKELRDAQFQLSDLLPKLAGLKDKLNGTQIRSPATGQVVGLTVFTVGGVVGPGAKLLDVVPDQAPLVVEAQISPNDRPDLYVGQETQVKITGMHDRDLPILKGKLTHVSADSMVDEKTGQRYFTAEVTVPVEALAIIQKIRGADGGIKAGLPVQVLVPLRKRTAFQYLTEPLTTAMWKSFREH